MTIWIYPFFCIPKEPQACSIWGYIFPPKGGPEGSCQVDYKNVVILAAREKEVNRGVLLEEYPHGELSLIVAFVGISAALVYFLVASAEFLDFFGSLLRVRTLGLGMTPLCTEYYPLP